MIFEEVRHWRLFLEKMEHFWVVLGSPAAIHGVGSGGTSPDSGFFSVSVWSFWVFVERGAERGRLERETVLKKMIFFFIYQPFIPRLKRCVLQPWEWEIRASARLWPGSDGLTHPLHMPPSCDPRTVCGSGLISFGPFDPIWPIFLSWVRLYLGLLFLSFFFFSSPLQLN